MKETNVTLEALTCEDKNQFILDNQYAFKFGACEEFGLRDDHFEEGDEIISRKTIEQCIQDGKAFRICLDGNHVGGLVLKINEKTNHNELELLFVDPKVHSKGIGYGAWKEVERMYPDTLVWETYTPYFEKRNIHFYVNKCGFHIAEFYCSQNRDPHEYDHDGTCNESPDCDGAEMFRFEKIMKPKQ